MVEVCLYESESESQSPKQGTNQDPHRNQKKQMRTYLDELVQTNMSIEYECGSMAVGSDPYRTALGPVFYDCLSPTKDLGAILPTYSPRKVIIKRVPLPKNRCQSLTYRLCLSSLFISLWTICVTIWAFYQTVVSKDEALNLLGGHLEEMYRIEPHLCHPKYIKKDSLSYGICRLKNKNAILGPYATTELTPPHGMTLPPPLETSLAELDRAMDVVDKVPPLVVPTPYLTQYGARAHNARWAVKGLMAGIDALETAVEAACQGENRCESIRDTLRYDTHFSPDQPPPQKNDRSDLSLEEFYDTITDHVDHFFRDPRTRVLYPPGDNNLEVRGEETSWQVPSRRQMINNKAVYMRQWMEGRARWWISGGPPASSLCHGRTDGRWLLTTLECLWPEGGARRVLDTIPKECEEGREWTFATEKEAMAWPPCYGIRLPPDQPIIDSRPPAVYQKEYSHWKAAPFAQKIFAPDGEVKESTFANKWLVEELWGHTNHPDDLQPEGTRGIHSPPPYQFGPSAEEWIRSLHLGNADR